MTAARRTPGPRSGARLAAVSALGTVWFALNFFVVIPAGVLLLTGGRAALRLDALRPLGLVVILLAQAVMVVLVVRFVREGHGSPVPLAPPVRLLGGGLYAVTRNPMYLCYVLTIAGEALLFASWPLAAYAAAFWLLVHVYVVKREEPALAARFGEDYRAYCATVPRWIFR